MLHSRSTAWRWLATLVIFAGGPAPAQAGFTITDLGVIASTGSSIATPVAISAGGTVSGTVPVQGGGISAAIAQPGGMLQPISAPSGATSSVATSISSGGAVAGDYTTSNGHTLGFYTSGGSAVSINPLTNANGVSGTSVQVNGINGGQVVGTGGLPSVAGDRAFIMSGSSATMINPLGGGIAMTSPLSNWANGINSNGVVVGTSELSVGGLQQAFYTGTNNTPISLLSRNSAGNFLSSTSGIAIANDGDIAGVGIVGGSTHAFFAANAGGSLVDLGTLGASTSSFGLAVNDNALVVGDSGGRAFLWGGPEGMFDLNSLISTSNQANWVLTEATGINDANEIVGEGLLNGVLHAFELTPIAGEGLFAQPGVVPTPPAVVLSAVGFAMVLGWSRWRLRRERNAAPAGV
jgi:hypothetical protein